jgi:hypothetical protein
MTTRPPLYRMLSREERLAQLQQERRMYTGSGLATGTRSSSVPPALASDPGRALDEEASALWAWRVRNSGSHTPGSSMQQLDHSIITGGGPEEGELSAYERSIIASSRLSMPRGPVDLERETTSRFREVPPYNGQTSGRVLGSPARGNKRAPPSVSSTRTQLSTTVC